MAVCVLHRRSLRQLPQSLSEIADAEEDAPLSTDTIEVVSVMIVTPLRVLFCTTSALSIAGVSCML